MRCRLYLLVAAIVVPFAAQSRADERPNIILILIDDLGYGDLGCTGGSDVPTPNIDRLAAEGTRFTQFYVGSPICSPSRVTITTGQYPARHLINSYLAGSTRNRARGMPNFLDPKAPCIARVFHEAGYRTAHFGKWHMGGGRDVGNAPLPKAYGFDESLVSFEGLGDRVLPPGGLSQQSAKLGRGDIRHAPKHELTEIYVNRAIDFIDRESEKPFYIHLWLNDVHDAYSPKPHLMKKYEHLSDNPYRQQYAAVIDEMDWQIGRLVDRVDEQELTEETLIVLTSDNGPTAWSRYYKKGHDPPGSTAGMRGRKWSLYEGGIRMPLIVRQPGTVPAGKVNETTVVAAVDFFPTFTSLAGIEPPSDVDFDGVDMSDAFNGAEPTREKVIFWEYGRQDSYLQPGLENDRSPNLAIRDGDWKLLVNADGSDLELYNLAEDKNETNNVAAEHPAVVKRLSTRLLNWRSALPKLEEKR